MSPLQPLNALSPKVVKELGIVIEVSPVQQLNAWSPIAVNVSGSVMQLIPMQFVNTLDFIDSTPVGTMTLCNRDFCRVFRRSLCHQFADHIQRLEQRILDESVRHIRLSTDSAAM